MIPIKQWKWTKLIYNLKYEKKLINMWNYAKFSILKENKEKEIFKHIWNKICFSFQIICV